MINTTKTFTSSDGRILSYHQVIGGDIDLANGIFEIHVGSWETEDMSSNPVLITKFKVKYAVWSPDYYTSAEEMILTHPEWIDSAVVKPYPDSIWMPIEQTWWQPPSLPLADVKAARKEYVNAARLTANRTSFTYETKEIAVDVLSRSDIDGANGYILANNSFPAGWPGGWKCMDNTYVPITAIATWNLFYAAMVNQGTANFTKSQTLKAAIDAATTIAEVEVIVW
jgi:hypothetical protein